MRAECERAGGGEREIDPPPHLASTAPPLLSNLSPYRKGVFFFQILYSSLTRRSSTSSVWVGRREGIVSGASARAFEKGRPRCSAGWSAFFKEREARSARAGAGACTRLVTPGQRLSVESSGRSAEVVSVWACARPPGKRRARTLQKQERTRCIGSARPAPLSLSYRDSLPPPGRCPWWQVRLCVLVCVCEGRVSWRSPPGCCVRGKGGHAGGSSE